MTLDTRKRWTVSHPIFVFLTDSNAAPVFFAASTTTTAQKKSKLKSTNETDDSEDNFDDVIEIDRPDPPAVKDTFSQLATLKV
jgi:hypothetical protein